MAASQCSMPSKTESVANANSAQPNFMPYNEGDNASGNAAKVNLKGANGTTKKQTLKLTMKRPKNSRSVTASSSRLKNCGVESKYQESHKQLSDFYRYLRSVGRPHGFAKNIVNSVNKYLFWACKGQELTWLPITECEKIKRYVDVLQKHACLSECSICSFITSIERARQFAEYRKLVGKIDCKEVMFLADLLAHFRSLRKLRLANRKKCKNYGSKPSFVDPADLSRVVNNADYRERFDELATYAKAIVELKSWKTFDRRNFTFCLRYIIARLLLESKPKLSTICNMTFSDIETCKGTIDDPESKIKIIVADRKFSKLDKATLIVSGDTKQTLVNFAHFIRRVVPKVLKETRALVFTNSSGRKLTPSQISKHMCQYTSPESSDNAKEASKDE
ncbi:hypothetical protein TrispH2_002529 [Trichoplax sp. H2]|nr:hypothetical protein TrispH2_002529 [Trichoplax sp. H2]|eukprot:RDD45150.1 hypothetical protein TrispH2_002529 [Trichoplax sp. H2]